MKLIEALQELKLTAKKIQDQQNRLPQLCSVVSNEIPQVGGSVEAQTQEVNSIVQSIFDLGDYYTSLKLRIEKTNNATLVEIDGVTKSLTEWMVLERAIGGSVMSTARLINTKRAEDMVSRMPTGAKENITIIPCFDSKKLSEKFTKYNDMVARISAKKETTNAVTDLLD